MAKPKPTLTKQQPPKDAKKPQAAEKTLADCRRARHDYFILETMTAGLVLQGWEVKAARAGRAQLNESYIVASRGEIFMLGAHFSPLAETSTHKEADPTRSRKLLLQKKEISRLRGKVKQAGLTIVPLRMYVMRGKIKLAIGLARGKKQHDRRETIKQKQWNRDKQRILKTTTQKK